MRERPGCGLACCPGDFATCSDLGSLLCTPELEERAPAREERALQSRTALYPPCRSREPDYSHVPRTKEKDFGLTPQQPYQSALGWTFTSASFSRAEWGAVLWALQHLSVLWPPSKETKDTED